MHTWTDVYIDINTPVSLSGHVSWVGYVVLCCARLYVDYAEWPVHCH